jgi:hypothetical protein
MSRCDINTAAMLIINNLDEVFAFIEKQAEKDMEKAL